MNDMQLSGSPLKVGLYVDVSNINMNGGFGMRFDVLRDFACRSSGQPIRLNAYVSYDRNRAQEDLEYRTKQQRYHATLRDFGYKVIIKDMKVYVDDAGNRTVKSNVDLDLAVDALLQSERLDRVVLASGDGDFVQVVRALQNRGCRVEVIAFDNVSGDLRREADFYVSGYIIPYLLPLGTSTEREPWGEVGSRTRGVCYAFDVNKGFGWIRYLRHFQGDLWRTDAREPDSPYETLFFHCSNLTTQVDFNILTSRRIVLEFDIDIGNREKPEATNIAVIETLT